MYLFSYSFYLRDSLFSMFIFFFNDTATTEIYTLSLHDALPISTRFSPALEYASTVGTTRSQVAPPATNRSAACAAEARAAAPVVARPPVACSLWPPA